jgi:hypothetical protein
MSTRLEAKPVGGDGYVIPSYALVRPRGFWAALARLLRKGGR